MKQPERYVEPRLTQYLFDRASRTLTPLSGTFELSPVCNLACKMCYVRKTPAEVAASPRPPVGLIQWLSIAEQARDAGMLYLLLTGGEPFLWQDFWPLYERLSTMGFLISINSNGTLLDEARVARLAEHPPTRINITLYGAGNETYEALCGRSGMFDRVDRAITLLRQAGILVKLNCSLTPHNACDLERIVSYAAERDLILEVNTYMFPPLRRDPAMVGRNDRFSPAETAHYHMERYRLQRGEEDFTRFLQNILRGIAPPPGLDEDCVDPVDGTISCRAGNASFWVTWDGWLTPCGMMPKPRIELKGKPFREAWSELTRVSSLQASRKGLPFSSMRGFGIMPQGVSQPSHVTQNEAFPARQEIVPSTGSTQSSSRPGGGAMPRRMFCRKRVKSSSPRCRR